MASDPRLELLLHQLSLAYDQRSWHGPNLRGSLRGVTPEIAAWRPMPGRHNVWELAVHCAYWKYRVCRLVSSTPPPAFSLKGSDWFERPVDATAAAWTRDLALLDDWHAELLAAAQAIDPERLDEKPGNSEFTFAELVSGAAAHDFYHAGQIRLVRRMHGR